MNFHYKFSKKKGAEYFLSILLIGILESLEANLIDPEHANRALFSKETLKFIRSRRIDKIITGIIEKCINAESDRKTYINTINSEKKFIEKKIKEFEDGLLYYPMTNMYSERYKERMRIAKELLGVLDDEVIADRVMIELKDIKKLRKQCI